MESKKWASYTTYYWYTRKYDKDWLICKNTTTKLKSFREIAPKELKKNIVGGSKDPWKSDGYLIEENKPFETPDH